MFLEKIIKARTTPSLEAVKEPLRNMNKMKVGQFYLCGRCDSPILKPEDGFVVHGNIYVADPTCRGGLIGNSFPDVKPGDKIEVSDVMERVYCKSCFLTSLGLHEERRKYR